MIFFFNLRNNVFRIIVEWNLNSAINGLLSDPELIINDFSLIRNIEHTNGSPVTLLNLLQVFFFDFIFLDYKLLVLNFLFIL